MICPQARGLPLAARFMFPRPQLSCPVSLGCAILSANISLAESFGEVLMNLKVVSLTAVAIAAFTASAFAHHSFAMFDQQQTVTVQGTVKEFEWTNPHAWLRVMIDD